MSSLHRLGPILLLASSIVPSCSGPADDADDDTGSTSPTDPTSPTSPSAGSSEDDTSAGASSTDPTGVDGSSSGVVDDDSTGAGSTTGGVDPIDYAGEMNGYRWELPCADPSQRDTCPWDPALLEGAVEDPTVTLRRETVVTFGGDAGVVYDVQIRIRGLVEPKDFTGGKVQENHFQIGGTPGTNDYNIYAVEVGDPAQIYTLNRNEMGIGHYTFIVDYTVTIPIAAGAEVVMSMVDPNDIAIANPGGASGSTDPYVVPDIPPFPEPFYGQFLQMDVLSVSPQ
jgi:hypothetical protein